METKVDDEVNVTDYSEEFADIPQAIIDYKDANWMVRRMREQEEAIQRINEQQVDEIGRILARARELREAHESRLEYLKAKCEPLLQEFTRKEIDGKKERSIKLLSGTVGFRKGVGSLDFTDEPAAVAWAEANLPDAIKVTVTLQKKPVKDLVEGTGEVPPGCEYTPGEDKFYIKIV
jgi:tetrahydromethanopterin S-methyltransferase subunit G